MIRITDSASSLNVDDVTASATFVKQMSIAPTNLTGRLESLFCTEPYVAASQIEQLVQETLALVEIYMPQVDTSSVKRRLGWRQQPWQPIIVG